MKQRLFYQILPSQLLGCALLLLSLSCTTACDDEEDTDFDISVSSEDMYRPQFEGFDAEPSRGGQDISRSLRSFGETCSKHSDCTSDYCISSGEEGVCTETCLGTSCPEGWGCLASTGTGPDIQYLCSPIQSRLCKACASNNDCPSGQCITIDGQSVCGKDCTEDSDCPGSYLCEELDTLGNRQCVPQTYSCSCNVNTEGTQRVCERSNDLGSCYGRQRCDSTLGWSTCDALAPVPEVCNQIDDDCNGLTDDVPMLGEACMNEADITNELGESENQVCLGRMICTTDQLEPICTADTPIAELCNYLDDDCDGNADELFPNRGELCSVGQGVCQRFGIYDCTENGQNTQCNVVPGEESAEICDGLDNDCDGSTDEGFSQLGEVCEVGQGLCRRVGVNRCSDVGETVVCSVSAAQPDLEICDGLDNDCDGQIDNGFNGLNEICVVGVGFCQQAGFVSCTADGASVACDVSELEASQNAQAELCDRVDNDCDNKVDEDFPTLNQVCQVGLGACERRGLMVCDESQAGLICSVTVGEASTEQCNQVDDDCDGSIDETWPDLGQSCVVGLGVCQRAGVVSCTGDQSQALCNAEQVTGVAQELCDYLDDDCDGFSDEDFLDNNQEYTLVEHCGACGNDCSQAWGGTEPSALGVRAVCNQEQGRPSCDFECLEGFLDADGRSSNGCELRADPNVIYVTPEENGGSQAGNCGSITTPCFSISHGLVRAQAVAKSRVLVSEGVYNEVVNLVDGISVIGGHDRVSWTHEPNVYVSQIDTRTLALTEAHSYAVKGIGIRSSTTLSGFTIYSSSSAPGGNAYAIYLRDCTQDLDINHNRVIAGDGARGIDGSSGENGADGLTGINGQNSQSFSQPLSCGGDPRNGFSGIAGGQAPSQSCGSLSTRGGSGGYSACPVFMEPNTSGSGGEGIGAGFGGISATHFQSNNPNTCAITNDNTAYTNPDARSGYPGNAGVDGQGGQHRGVALGRNRLGHWLAETGVDGETGIPGGGGGGGGAAAGVVVEWSANQSDFGASGGSGGNGGCSGAGGTGGTGGGGSFGIFITYVSLNAVSSDQLPRLSSNTITRGFGGIGGRGGNGGGGGAGGSGGAGGLAGDVLNPICSFQAGNGGVGGRGGHGGAGAGGNGGISFDIAVSTNNGASMPTSYQSQNIFSLADAIDTAGGGGTGGNSSNNTVGGGEAGLKGLSGQVGEL
ncbi:MAG: hypothetical protein CMH49_00830 [Myxococcales bacterium]|nr:hypothetical protein [Myxococcales bacterium]